MELGEEIEKGNNGGRRREREASQGGKGLF